MKSPEPDREHQIVMSSCEMHMINQTSTPHVEIVGKDRHYIGSWRSWFNHKELFIQLLVEYCLQKIAQIARKLAIAVSHSPAGQVPTHRLSPANTNLTFPTPNLIHRRFDSCVSYVSRVVSTPSSVSEKAGGFSSRELALNLCLLALATT